MYIRIYGNLSIVGHWGGGGNKSSKSHKATRNVQEVLEMGSLSEQYKRQQEDSGDGSRAFSLRNLAMVVGVVVLLALLALVVQGLIPKSGEELYNQDLELVGKKVLLYSSGYSPAPVTQMNDGGGKSANQLLGKRPTRALKNLGTGKAQLASDVLNGVIVTLGLPETNPVGGVEVGYTPSWQDGDKDGKRIPQNDVLYYSEASPEPATDHWNTVTVTVDGIDYVVDSRDWFVNFDRMLEQGYIEDIPESGSPDNSDNGTGSYSYYVDENLEVKTMLYERPLKETNGYQNVYP